MIISDDMVKCTNCQFPDLCKWVPDMDSRLKDISKMPASDDLSPIKINVTCSRFQRKTRREDGFHVHGI